MKTRRNFWAILVVFAALAVMAGCELQDQTTGPDSQPPPFPVVAFKGPQTNSTNAEAQYTKTAVEAMNGFSSYFLIFSGLTATASENTFTWTYTVQNLTIRLTATRQSNGDYAWKMIYNGSDSQGRSYNNWTSLEGTTSADSRSGSWIVYEENSTTKAADYTWSTNSANALTGSFKLYSAGVLATQITLTSNADNTGELKIYDGALLVYRSVWQANGSGQWWRYDANGNITSSGSWT
ncbi:MAG TPA: hypothetical protein VNL36_03055 [Bacteroidota bacterium]|nr:hypothetical protein [Bacteroidota bacterium]